jgi:PucR family transcriptional regulator, purine catabolism regulatory protein
MVHSQFAYQPTLRQLLSSEAFAEAQVLCGDDRIDAAVTQVISNLSSPFRSGSLLVNKIEAFEGKELKNVADLSAVVVIKSLADTTVRTVRSSRGQSGAEPVAKLVVPALAPTPNYDAALKQLIKVCQEVHVPLISLPGFGDLAQIADEVRFTFLRQLKLNSTRLHTFLMNLVVEEGLEGLVEEVSNQLNRPVSIESAQFSLMASKNMGGTPASQQRSLVDDVHKSVRKQLKVADSNDGKDWIIPTLKVGKRLVAPIMLGENIVGYISSMVRPNDDMEAIAELLRPAALAAMIEFHQNRQTGPMFAATQKSLLRDLLLGGTLAASDQERMEQHYGFDMADGILVFAASALNAQGQPLALDGLPDSFGVMTEIEGTATVVVPYLANSGKTWQQVAEALQKQLKELVKQKPGGADAQIQIGAGRMSETTFDLAESYREARQALIVGSMMHTNKEFTIGYGELGVKRLLYLMIDHPELERFCEEIIEPLESYDEEWESELVPSLRVYLAEGANLNSAARALFIHRHTLRYRLEQIAEILKVDIDSQEVLLNLQIAFQIRDMMSGSTGKRG